MKLSLTVLKDKYAIYKFDSSHELPNWVYDSEFFTITKTKDELSVVTFQNDISSGEIDVKKDWRILKILGTLDFSLVGIIADISQILKEEQISIFVISTYDTDYILIKENAVDNAKTALKKNGYNFQDY